MIAGGDPNIAATIVNNNAAAVLPPNALACGRGRGVANCRNRGGLRTPDVMRRALQVVFGEIGFTNRSTTGISAEAIGPRTALLMKVYTSNYAIVGFTVERSTRKRAEIAHAAGPTALVDPGSGTLTDFAAPACLAEPTPQQALRRRRHRHLSGDSCRGVPAGRADVGRK